MSNTGHFGLTKIPKIRFISVDHGYKEIILAIIESQPSKSLEITLSCKEAKKLVTDLSQRILEIEKTPKEKS